MYCMKCGANLVENAGFCTKCGAKQNLSTDPIPKDNYEEENPLLPLAKLPRESHPEEAKKLTTSNADADAQTDTLANVVGKNTDYYLPEFERIAAGGTPKFNWAAFFLGLVLCLYRKCGKLSIRYSLPPLIALVIPIIILTYGVISVNLTLIIVGASMNFAIWVWSIINWIRLGKNFNRDYYIHCQNVLAQRNEKQYGTSTKAVLLFHGILLAVIITASVGIIFLVDSYNARDYYDEVLPSFSESQIVASEPPVEPVTEPPAQATKPIQPTKPKTSTQPESDGYYTYENEFKEYSIAIPELFYPVEDSTTDNGDGCAFYDSTGNSDALITVYGAYNVLGETGESYRDENDTGAQYSYASKNLYVESDYVDDENIYYEAILFTDEKVVAFQIIYPAGSSTYYDGVIDHMMKSLKANEN